jgi:hypothetical protein
LAAYGYEDEFEHADFREILEEINRFIAEVDEFLQRGGQKLQK